jgi:glutamine amidotransferase
MKNPVIVASGGANIASLQYALERLGSRPRLSADSKEIEAATHVILPGVGAAQDAMSRLDGAGLSALIPLLKQPVLGICLGMQLLYEGSEEQNARCLGVFPGRARRFDPAAGRPVPHMGWNRLRAVHDHPLLADICEGEFVYFVHSYALAPAGETVAVSEYGAEFSAIVSCGNFHGAQFHPERSAATGAKFLANFLGLS